MHAADERRRELERRLGISRAHHLWLSCVFFFLTSLMVAAMFFLFGETVVAGVASIVLAELLIRRWKFDWPGVISAFWLGGLFALIATLPHSGKPEALLLLAAASAIAGWRVRNALFGALTVVLVIAYFAEIDAHVTALVTGIAIAAAALIARAREWQRPSTDDLFIALLLAAPVAGAVASIERTSILWALAYVALAVAEVGFGERKRDRVALMAAAISLVIAVVTLREVFAFALEWKLIASGAILFAIAAVVSKKLRGHTRGLVLTPEKRAYEEALRIFGTAAFAPHVAHEPVQQPVGAGGSFGGAGATGDY